MDLKSLQEKSHAHAVSKGFWDETERPEAADEESGIPTFPPSLAEKLCLVHSEVSEALEDYRTAQDLADLMMSRFDESGKPIGFASELADIIIRVADIAEKVGIDLEQEVLIKMAYNAKRPHRHGGKNL